MQPTGARGFQLAQVNVARMRGSIESRVMSGFVAQLERINALADTSVGFVWRFQTEAGDATAVRAYDDERILFNLSVWDSAEALHAYIYKSAHVKPLRDRAQWFEHMEGPNLALWWIPWGHIPPVEEAKQRLAALATDGPTRAAFTFKELFPAPNASPAHITNA